MHDVIPASVPGLDLCREYGHHQSPAIRAGGLIFCSGMVAINPESGEREHGTVTHLRESETASGVRRLDPGPNRAGARDDL